MQRQTGISIHPAYLEHTANIECVCDLLLILSSTSLGSNKVSMVFQAVSGVSFTVQSVFIF